MRSHHDDIPDELAEVLPGLSEAFAEMCEGYEPTCPLEWSIEPDGTGPWVISDDEAREIVALDFPYAAKPKSGGTSNTRNPASGTVRHCAPTSAARWLLTH
jgi:hypothetical protein